MEAELINAALAALAGCVCEELAESGDLCFCGLTVGDQYISMAGIGDCEDKCGEAWVRIVSATVGEVPGEPQQNPTTCSAEISLSLEVGVLRCSPVEDDGEAPTAHQLLCASADMVRDMVAVKRAISCCDHFDTLYFQGWTPMGPEGGVVGGAWTITVAL